MEINIKIIYGKEKHCISCSPTETFRDLKEKIEKHFEISLEDQKLIVKGHEPKDTTTLKEGGLSSGGKVMLLLSSSHHEQKNLKNPCPSSLSSSLSSFSSSSSTKDEKQSSEQLSSSSEQLSSSSEQLSSSSILFPRMPFSTEENSNSTSTLFSTPSPYFIQIVHGKEKLTIPMDENETIGDVKKALYNCTGIPIKHQKLLFKGKIRQDSENLHEMEAKKGSKMILMLTENYHDQKETTQNLQSIKNKVHHEETKVASLVSRINRNFFTSSDALLQVSLQKDQIDQLHNHLVHLTTFQHEEVQLRSKLMETLTQLQNILLHLKHRCQDIQ